MTTLHKNRVPHLRDGFIVAKVGIARRATLSNTQLAAGLRQHRNAANHQLIHSCRKQRRKGKSEEGVTFGLWNFHISMKPNGFMGEKGIYP
jgi:hypothetical protein